MPNIELGNAESQSQQFRGAHFDYEYPNGLNLKPGSKLHDTIKDRLLERAKESSTHMSSRYGSWNNIDQFLTAYKPLSEEEDKLQSEDSTKPVSIVFPYSFAILETLLSYMTSAFFQDPIFRYEGYSPDDVMGAIMMEKVIQLHNVKFKNMLNLHTMFRDGFAYGIGPVAPIWKSTPNGAFSGNALVNIDPYRYLPDPNTPADQIQDGEYVGWVNSTNYMDLMSEETTSKGEVFNVKYLKALTNRGSSITNSDNSGRNIRTGLSKPHSSLGTSIDEIPMYIKIIPSDWGLGSKTTPEKWFFRLAADAVVIAARPADFDHGKFPLTVCAPDYDGYSCSPISRLEILSGLQGVLDFLFNSHITNVRKAINDMIIYDPYMVNSADLKDPKPGKLIRMRRPAWGKGIQDSVKQLMVNDITRANIGDSTWIVQWMQKIGATDDAAMGSLRSGGPERLTAKEFQGTASGAVSRLERMAKIIGLQSMQDIGEFFADHTKQMMTDDMYIKVAGTWQEMLLKEYEHSISRGRMTVSPKDMDIMYDLIVRDGSIPGSNFSEIWPRMFETISENPELQKEFDIVKIFKHIARNSGAKNTEDFVRRGVQPIIMPDADVADQVNKGNLIPAT